MSDTNISHDAARAATGHGWAHWFDALDGFGAAEAGHKESASWLHEEHGLSGWWAQMITVQYERDRRLREIGEASGGFQMGAQRTFLPDPGVDTGLGLERIVSVQQGEPVNYDTDLFQPAMRRVQELLGDSDEERETHATGYRVIADHGRAATFLIADGVLPSNVMLLVRVT